MDPNGIAMTSQTVAVKRKNFLAGVVVLLGLMLAVAPAARAQNENAGSMNLDYTYLRADSSGNGGVFSAYGATAAGGVVLREPLSIVGEIQVYSFLGQPAGEKGQMLTYVLGPELNVPIRHSRWGVNADILLGGGYLRGEEFGQVSHENSFVFDFGEGLTANVNDRWSIQVVKVEYLMTNFRRINGDSGRQNDMRVSVGFTYHIQKRTNYR